MTRALILAVTAVSVAGQQPAASPQAAPETMIGWVSDGHCREKHMREGGEKCVRLCIAGAVHVDPRFTPGGMVLVTEDKKVWKVDNPDALWGLESRRVEVRARPNRERMSAAIVEIVTPKAK